MISKKEHLLLKLSEEAVETALEMSQLLHKSIIFGLDSRYGEGKPTNLERTVDELNDLLGVVSMLEDEGVLPEDWLDPAKIHAKKEKINKFLEVSRRLGKTEPKEHGITFETNWGFGCIDALRNGRLIAAMKRESGDFYWYSLDGGEKMNTFGVKGFAKTEKGCQKEIIKFFENR